MPDIPGSLVLGGYDSSRCLTNPIVSNSQSVELSKISLGVTSGGCAYSNGNMDGGNFLWANGSQSDTLEVYPNPSVPYLYLPQDTCDKLAAQLPVTYNHDFNLYFWDTSDSAYEQIVQSPHYIGFTFTSNGQDSTINVPFALLNLTLESPLVSKPTPYFPCSPWVPKGAPYHLGRAFLQGAFLAQNWETKKLFLAQAPGPDLGSLSPYVKTIAGSDDSLSPATNPPNWESTWSSTLKPLSHNVTSSSSSSKNQSSGLSGGVIAGIVVAAVAGVALVASLVIWFTRRRKAATWPKADDKQGLDFQDIGEVPLQPPVYAYEKDGSAMSPSVEADSTASRVELDGYQARELEDSSKIHLGT